MVRLIVVEWCDSDRMLELARSRGWDENSEASILDLVEESEAEHGRQFATIASAKSWARRNKVKDFWQQPSVRVYEYPDVRCLSWQRETVKHIRYVGDGCGWDDLTQY